MKFFLSWPPAANDAIFTAKSHEKKQIIILFRWVIVRREFSPFPYFVWRDVMWGQHQNIKNQISQHFADRCLGIRENTGKLFIIILASLIWLIICWHQDRSIIFPIYVQSFIFHQKMIFFIFNVRTFRHKDVLHCL